MSASAIIALSFGTGAVLMLAGALWATVRVTGGLSAVRMRLAELEHAHEILDSRITREVKARAGATGAQRVAEERSIAEEAQAILNEAGNSAGASARPSRLRR